MLQKTCTKCGTLKALDLFSLQKAGLHGRAAACKACRSAEKKAYRSGTKEAHAAYNRQWREANAERHAASSKAWYEANRQKVLQRCKERFAERYTVEKPVFVARAIARRVAQSRATPPWADQQAILSIYRHAEELRSLGLDVHVDHDIPLRGKDVCGLHVHNNLQVLLAEDNLRKGNRVMLESLTHG